jgi:hypothetical protein
MFPPQVSLGREGVSSVFRQIAWYLLESPVIHLRRPRIESGYFNRNFHAWEISWIICRNDFVMDHLG